MKRLRVNIGVLKTQSSPTLLFLGATLIFACLPGCRLFEREPPYYCPPGCCAPTSNAFPASLRLRPMPHPFGPLTVRLAVASRHSIVTTSVARAFLPVFATSRGHDARAAFAAILYLPPKGSPCAPSRPM